MGNCVSAQPESSSSRGKLSKKASVTRVLKGACQFNRSRRQSSVVGFRGANGGTENYVTCANRKNPGSAQVPVDTSFGFARDISSKYDLEYEVGRGHFGHTCAGTIKKGERKGERVAVKVISKARLETEESVEDVRREVLILKALVGHENVIKFYEALEDNSNVYIVMELCLGGELLDRMLARGGVYTENQAQPVIRQMLKILAWLQAQGVVHRDLKPENFLFATTDEEATLKVIDFGLSEFVPVGGQLTDIVGSAYYVAPEVLKQSYGVEADLWSVGVICYTLLCGGRPFFARSESEVFEAVLQTEPRFEEEQWRSVSPLCIDFIKNLLTKDSRGRISAVQALCHPWMMTKTADSTNDSSSRFVVHPSSSAPPPPPPPPKDVPLDTQLIATVTAFSWMDHAGRDALQAVAETLKDKELAYQRSQFDILDSDSDGYVQAEDFKRAILTLTMPQGTTNVKSSAVMPLAKQSLQVSAAHAVGGGGGGGAEVRPPPSMSKALRLLMEIAEGMNKVVIDTMNFKTFVAASICMEQLTKEVGWEKRKKEAYRIFTCTCTAKSTDAAWKNSFLPEMQDSTAAANRLPYNCCHRSKECDVVVYRLTEEEFEQILLELKSGSANPSAAEEMSSSHQNQKNLSRAMYSSCASQAENLLSSSSASTSVCASSSGSASSAA